MPRRSPRTEQIIGLRAAPDTGSLGRLGGILGAVGASVKTFGSTIGPDRGDPTVTFTGPVRGTPSPTAAIAAIAAGPRTIYLEPSDYSDAVPTDTSLDPYRALLLNRMGSR